MDEKALLRHRRFEDPRRGLAEEFLQPELGGGRTVAVLSTPLGPAQPVGWVICHSFGLEQINLNRTEVVAARALAAAGFPVLRYQSQGYGDSAERSAPARLAAHLDAAADAAALLARQAGVERVALLGARFGALVAALVADRTGLRLLGLWHPFVTGQEFLDDSFAATRLAEKMGRAGGAGGGLLEDLRTKGWSDVNGFLLTREAFEEIAAIDLRDVMRRFRGEALLMSVTRTGTISEPAAALGAHLRSLGASCTDVLLQERAALAFGHHHFLPLPDGEGDRDITHGLNRNLAAATVRWASAVVPESASSRLAP
jgi:pimeloyl-ACP methyl ester carboxylesterase